MQFEVPQFIEIEDKIFGPLTWKQFLYVAGGSMAVVALFILTPFIVFVLLGLPIAGLAFALAFYPVNNRPFLDLLEAVWTFFSRHRVYYWQRRQPIVYKDAPVTTELLGNPNVAGHPTGTQNISSLARRLELDAMQKK